MGSVVDPSNLPVAGVALELRQLGTGSVRRLSTGVDGNFVFSNLVPGEYVLTAEASGFKKIERKRLMLSASEVLPVGKLTLAVGTLTETVTVVSQGELVQTASSERSGVVTSNQVDNLLTKSRNVMSLLQLLPGVVDTSSDADSLSRNWNINVQGNRVNTNSLTVDGLPLNAWGNGNATDIVVSQDSIAEVAVLVGNYQAEYGRRSGANITLVSKSGSQTFHGTASYFKRHEQFNATNFFDNRNSIVKPRYRYNTYVYGIGGPIYIPNTFNRNKDKLFFFWNQEIWPSTIGVTGKVTMPTALERGGDFSQTVDLSKVLIPVKDPTTGKPFANNVVPAARIDASGQSLLKLFPLPNFSDWGISKGAYNYVFSTPVSKPTRSETLRVDHNVNSSNRASFSYYHYLNTQTGAQSLDTGTSNWPEVSQRYQFKGQSVLGRYTRILSPTFINELTVGFTSRPQTLSISQDELSRYQRKQIGFTAGQLYPENNSTDLRPDATFGGVPGTPANLRFVANGYPWWQKASVVNVTDTLTKTLGAHTLKVGMTGDFVWNNTITAVNSYGNFAFDRSTLNPLDSNYAYSNAVLGVFQTYTEVNRVLATHTRYNSVHWFVQDAWKVTPRLTLEYGLRFSWMTPMYESSGAMAAFSPGAYDTSRSGVLIQPVRVNNVRMGYNPVTGATSAAATIGAIASWSGAPYNGMIVNSEVPESPRGMYKQVPPLLGPRFGFAYDLFGNGKTALRGGFGMFYNEPGSAVGTVFKCPPLVVTPTTYYGELSKLRSSQGFTFPQTVYSSDQNSKMPSVINVSLSVQRRVPYDVVLDIGYSGSVARNLFWQRDLNTVPLGTRFTSAAKDPTTGGVLSTAFLVPITGYLNIYQFEAAGSSNYHSLQVSANRRFAAGLQFQASWSWSKAMNFGDVDSSTVSPLSPRSWDYGLAGYDRTHVLKGSVIWDVPGPSWRNPLVRAVLNDWRLSVMPSFVSGAPVAVSWSSTTGDDTTGTPSQNARVVVTGNPVLPKSERTFSRNFRSDVFQLPAVGTFGNAARTLLRGPGINNFDVGLFKIFPIKEFGNLQYRCEMYNAFNHTQFSSFDSSVRFDANGNQINSRAGQFTGARNPRIIQMALRFEF